MALDLISVAALSIMVALLISGYIKKRKAEMKELKDAIQELKEEVKNLKGKNYN